MNSTCEDMLLSKISISPTKTPYAILISGKRDCIPDILTLLNSIKSNIDLHLYTIIYFYQDYTKDELNLIEKLHPDIYLYDIDLLAQHYSFLNAFKLLCHGHYGSPLGAKFYSLKLLEIFKAVVYLDRDTIVLKDFTQYLKNLECSDTDIAALPCKDELFLFFKKRILSNESSFKAYCEKFNLPNSNNIVQLTNNGVVFFFSSLLRQLDAHTTFNEIERLCRFCTADEHNQLTDEEVLCFLVNKHQLKFTALPKEYNYITGFTGISFKDTSTSDFKNISILHLGGSDKRSPAISCLFPEVDRYVTDLVHQPSFIYLSKKFPSSNWIIQDLNSNSFQLNNAKHLEFVTSYRNFKFFKENSFEIFSFLAKSKFFYTEKMQNNEYFMIFIKNISQSTRLNLRPCFINLWDIEANLRIHYSDGDLTPSKYLDNFNSSHFIEDFQEAFLRSSISHDNKYIHLRFFFHRNDLLKELNKLEVLFAKHEDELFLSLIQ